MKEPKAFKHPRLYTRTQSLNDATGLRDYTRLRIIHPNGQAEWGDLSKLLGRHLGAFNMPIPCWVYRKNKSGHSAVADMKYYDEAYGYTTIFLGEIK